jgi:hypothetical protein
MMGLYTTKLVCFSAATIVPKDKKGPPKLSVGSPTDRPNADPLGKMRSDAKKLDLDFL